MSTEPRLRVAFGGEPGAYGEEAILGYFGADTALPVGAATFAAAARLVEDGATAAAMLPIESSRAGTVGDAVDVLIGGTLRVRGELLLPVRHQLLALPGVGIDDIERVASHPQALAQCDSLLTEHGWQPIPSGDTASAARALAEDGDRRTAVIASMHAANRYGLQILADLAREDRNVTRFVLVTLPERTLPAGSGPLAPAPDAARASIISFETKHMPGALYEALGAFAQAGVNLSRIESRPTRNVRWEYRFLVQIEGDTDRPPASEALAALRDHAHAVAVLGNFPSARA
ncbi:MAG: prephenate dehydratase domain-containing protein [Chloroflexota bacterium]